MKNERERGAHLEKAAVLPVAFSLLTPQFQPQLLEMETFFFNLAFLAISTSTHICKRSMALINCG